MSSSTGSPSNKCGWYRSMTAKLNHENKLFEEALRLAENPKYQPKVKLSQKKKAKDKFEVMLSEAKEEINRRREQARKAAQKAKREKTVDSNSNN